MGNIVRVDHNTLLRLKGKFARVCVNIDIIHPLLDSLSISRGGLSTRVPLIYEGLHEVCPLCGGDLHQLESCPNLPVSKQIEVLIERFDAQGVSPANKSVIPSGTTLPNLDDTWVIVSPKKSVRAMHSSKQSKASSSTQQPSKTNPTYYWSHSELLGKIHYSTYPLL